MVWIYDFFFLYLVELGMKGTAELHVLHQVGALALVRSDDADLVRFGSSLQKASSDFLHISSLSPAHTTSPHSQFSGKKKED